MGTGHSLLQHHCAPMHEAKSIKTWLNESGVEEMYWTAQSHALKPIQHFWCELERRLWARPSRPASLPDLTSALLNKWAKHPKVWCKAFTEECYSPNTFVLIVFLFQINIVLLKENVLFPQKTLCSICFKLW